MTIRVFLAEDQPVVSAGFAAVLAAESGIVVVGGAATGIDAVERAVELVPDVVVMDARMPELDCLEATRQIVANHRLAATKVMILTTIELDEFVFGALRAGASGFLLKGGEPTDLLRAIRVVAAGESLLAPSITRRLIAAYVAQPTTRLPEGLELLTRRELEVMTLVARGDTNLEIARALYLSPLTVRTHVSQILAKMSARDRVQLVVMAYQAGLVLPEASPP
jgi:DNA-binding NarL/FixJ family response regulator